jgi:hypothetical protein
MVLREILTRFVDRALHPLVDVLILSILFCLSSAVVILMKNSYIYEHLETFILNFFNAKCYDSNLNTWRAALGNSLAPRKTTAQNHLYLRFFDLD